MHIENPVADGVSRLVVCWIVRHEVRGITRSGVLIDRRLTAKPVALRKAGVHPLLPKTSCAKLRNRLQTAASSPSGSSIVNTVSVETQCTAGKLAEALVKVLYSGTHEQLPVVGAAGRTSTNAAAYSGVTSDSSAM